MKQLLKFSKLIPSCKIHSLEYDSENKQWWFIYALNTPFEINNHMDWDSINKNYQPLRGGSKLLIPEHYDYLIIYEYISDLHLKFPMEVHPESVNIKVRNLDDYIKILDCQREADLDFRRQWLEKNPDAKPNTIVLPNKNLSHEELQDYQVNFLASIITQNENDTIFAGI